MKRERCRIEHERRDREAREADRKRRREERFLAKKKARKDEKQREKAERQKERADRSGVASGDPASAKRITTGPIEMSSEQVRKIEQQSNLVLGQRPGGLEPV